jgi:hypothetical protein
MNCNAWAKRSYTQTEQNVEFLLPTRIRELEFIRTDIPGSLKIRRTQYGG